MRAVDKKYFDKYAIDPVEEESLFDSFVEGWVDDFSHEETAADGYYADDWEDLV
jgi:hypothetical protein